MQEDSPIAARAAVVPSRIPLAALGALVFTQMLPATLVVPAIRPLFAAAHEGNESAMHAFMSVNMLGGALAAPYLGLLADRGHDRARLVALLCVADAFLLALLPLRLPIPLVLGLRLLEGAAHVGAASVLLGIASAHGRALSSGKVMGVAGTCLMLAVACGSALGGLVVEGSPTLVFQLGSALSLCAGLTAGTAFRRMSEWAPLAPHDSAAPRSIENLMDTLRTYRVPVGAAFIGRFTVGCIVVTFALFAHQAHGLSDRSIGFLFSLLTLPFALVMYPMARLGDCIPRVIVLGLGGIGYAACLVAIGYVRATALPFVMVAAGVTGAMLLSSTLCYGATLSIGPDRTRPMSLINSAGCLGMLFGPAVAGTTIALLSNSETPLRGYRGTFFLAAVCTGLWLVANVRWFSLRLKTERRRRPSIPLSVNG